MSLVIVSPHLDDAVFSCGTLLAASALHASVTVVTVCAGIPDEPGLLTQLDAAAGFETSREAVVARREEDAAALRLLGVGPDALVHLDVLDGQYDQGDPLDRRNAIRDAVAAAFATDTRLDGTAVAPVGIRHADHAAVAAACAPYAAIRYEELPYRVLWPEQRPMGLGTAWLTLPSCDAKRRAIECYRSQLGDGPAGPELAADEHYHLGGA